MNYDKMLQEHKDNGADATIAHAEELLNYL